MSARMAVPKFGDQTATYRNGCLVLLKQGLDNFNKGKVTTKDGSAIISSVSHKLTVVDMHCRAWLCEDSSTFSFPIICIVAKKYWIRERTRNLKAIGKWLPLTPWISSWSLWACPLLQAWLMIQWLRKRSFAPTSVKKIQKRWCADQDS